MINVRRLNTAYWISILVLLASVWLGAPASESTARPPLHTVCEEDEAALFDGECFTLDDYMSSEQLKQLSHDVYGVPL